MYRYVQRVQLGAYIWRKGLNWVKAGSNWADFTCMCIGNGPRSLLEKRVFDPFLTDLWSQNTPFSRHFGIFHGLKRVTKGSKLAKNTCLSIPSGLGKFLEKKIFFDPGTLVDPALAPTVRGPGYPPAPPDDHWYRGQGVSLGNSEGWKPQKVGGCGRTKCPRNLLLGHLAQHTAHSRFWGLLTQTAPNWAIFGHFWAISRTYRGVGGQQAALCHKAGKAHVEFSNCFPSFVHFDRV